MLDKLSKLRALQLHVYLLKYLQIDTYRLDILHWSWLFDEISLEVNHKLHKIQLRLLLQKVIDEISLEMCIIPISQVAPSNVLYVMVDGYS